MPGDEQALQAECLAAFERLKHPSSEGGFTFRYRGYDQFDPKQVYELLVEYRALAKPIVEPWEEVHRADVTAADKLNELADRFKVRCMGGAVLNKESFKRELRAGELKPHTPCTSPGAKVTGEWKDQFSIWKAEKQAGV